MPITSQTRRKATLLIAMSKQLDSELLRLNFHQSNIYKEIVATTELSAAISYCKSKPVSLAIFDLSFKNGTAIEAGKEIYEAKRLPIVFLDRHYSVLRAERVQLIPAAYYSRSVSLGKLTDFIYQYAHSGSRSFQQSTEFESQKQQLRLDCPETVGLTKRELEVWAMIAEGKSVKGCANELQIAESTVDNHKSRLMKKLKISKAVELTRLAIRIGLVDT